MERVILFAKEPVPGRVKTRLAATIGADAACAVYTAFVTDTLARLARYERARTVLAIRPADHGAPILSALAEQHHMATFTQTGADLGQRMANALERTIRADGKNTVLIGTDLPNLPLTHLDDAFDRLNRHELVFGPTTDGGYYLAGAAPRALNGLAPGNGNHWPDLANRLFGNIPWSAPNTLHTTLARGQGIPIALAPAWYDVDDIHDLHRLRRFLQHHPRPALPHTRAALEQPAIW